MLEAVTATAVACHVCGASGIEEIAGYAELHRVTSDCKPWRRGGRLAVCAGCGCVQKPIDDAWRAEAAEIYGAYEIYHQSRGAEQAVFEVGSERSSTRSERLIARMRAELGLPETGRLLDLGCGNGPFLRAFAAAAPAWRLTGADVGEGSRAAIEAIPGVEAYHAGDVEALPGGFDLAVMVHALEHVVDPGRTLVALRERLGPSGRLLLQLPSHVANPFELTVADHASHFTIEALRTLVEQSGFEPLVVADDWLPRELTVVARPCDRVAAPPPSSDRPGDQARRALAWLVDVAAAARAADGDGPLGVFGTSIAGTWLAAELKGRAAYFVDEDPNRAGRLFFDRPVYHPRSLPRGSRVFVALPHALATSVAARLSRAGLELVLPPAPGRP